MPRYSVEKFLKNLIFMWINTQNLFWHPLKYYYQCDKNQNIAWSVMGNLYTRLVGELALEFNQFRTKTNVPKLLGPEVISKVSQ